VRVLLIKPLYRFNSFHPVQYTNAEKPLPLALAYLAGVAQRAGHRLRVLDYQIDNSSIESELKNFRPDVVAFSIYSKEYAHAMELIDRIKRYRRSIRIVAGGPHVNAYKGKLLFENTNIEFLVSREGEHTFVELLQTVEAAGDYKKIKGLIFRDACGRIHVNEKRPFIKNLDSLPFMALEHFRVDKYYPAPGTFRKLPSILMITARGCPYRCTFCNTDLFGKSIRFRSAENVLEEIESCVKTYGAKEINFVDETFTMNRERTVDICQGLLRRNIKIGWKCSTRVDCVDKDLLKLMKRSGCFYVGFGVESGSDRILEKLKKGITTDQIRKAFGEAREVGILRAAYFMMNVPGETPSEIETSIQFSREIDPDFLNFELIKPYYGTQLRKEIENNPDIKINSKMWEKWDKYSAGNHLYYTQKGVDGKYLKNAYDRAVKKFYIRPRYILRMIFEIRSFKQLAAYVRAFLNALRIRVVFDDDR
jgi:anaerobic magnesium-protoporphyrin IX monomethyl ester cyclase